MLASDIPAVLERTTTVVPLDEGMVVEVRARGCDLHRPRGRPRSIRSR